MAETVFIALFIRRLSVVTAAGNTRQIIFPTSSATKITPEESTATPTDRPNGQAQKKLLKFRCFSLYIFMATFIGLIMNSKCQQTLIYQKKYLAMN